MRCVKLFADIFKNNAINMGILPVQVSPGFLDKIFSNIEINPNAEFKVSLPDQTITIVATGDVEEFEINGYKKITSSMVMMILTIFKPSKMISRLLLNQNPYIKIMHNY